MPNGEEYVFETKKTEPTDVGMISKDNRGRTISSVLNDTITQDEIKSKGEVRESSTKDKMSISKTLKNDTGCVLDRTFNADENNRTLNDEKN